MLQHANVFVLFALLVGGSAQFARRTIHRVAVNDAGDVTAPWMLAETKQHEDGGISYECDNGGMLAGKLCFQVHVTDAPVSYDTAKANCAAQPGVTLATINDEATELALAEQMRAIVTEPVTQLHFGLRNTLNERGEPKGPLYWESGENVSAYVSTYSGGKIKGYLTTGDTAIVNCAILTFIKAPKVFAWDHDECLHKSHYVCSYNATVVQPPSPTPPTPVTQECKGDWTSVDGECYKFTLFEKHEEPNVKYTHDMAEELCHAMGSNVHLATINSDAANKKVAELVGKYTEVHIGLKFSEIEKGLVWESGQPVKYEARWFNFTEAPGQNYVHKTDAAGECTRISGSTAHWNPSGWDDWPCADALRDGYVCSYTQTPAPTPATNGTVGGM